MMNPFILTQSPTPPLVAGFGTSNGTANPFATPPSESGSPMVSFLSILDQATAGQALPDVATAALPTQAVQTEAPLDDTGLNDLLTQLIQSLQQVQVQLPPEVQPEAQAMVDALGSSELKALLDQLTPSVVQALQTLDASKQETVVAESVIVPQTVPETLEVKKTSSSQPEMPQSAKVVLGRELRALAHIVTHMQQSMATSANEVSHKRDLAKLTQLVQAIQSNPNSPLALSEKLKSIEPQLVQLDVPRLDPKGPHLLAVQEALGEKLAKALEKAPDVFKPLIAETLEKLTAGTLKPKAHEKMVHPLQLELDRHRSQDQGQAQTLTLETGALADTAVPIDTQMPVVATVGPSDSPTDLSAGLSSAPLKVTSTIFSTERAETVATVHQNADTETLPPHLQVVQQAKMTIEAGRKQVTMQLNPYELGQVNLKITSHANNQVTIRLMTQTVEAHAALDHAVSQLAQSLSDQGVQIRDIQIVQAGQELVSSTAQSQAMSQFDANTPEHRENRSESGAQQQHSQQNPSQGQVFADSGSMSGQSQHLSNPFTDEGASMGEEIASSQIAFDTDVEGEEVTLSSSDRSQSASSGIDIRV